MKFLKDSDDDAQYRVPGATAFANSRELFNWVWYGYLNKHLGWFIVAMVLMAIEGGSLGAISYMVKPMFDQIFVDGNAGAIWTVGLAIVGIFVLRAATSVGQTIVMVRITQMATAQMRYDLLGRIMRQDGTFHMTHPPGFLVMRVQGDVSSVADVWRTIITGVVRDGISLIALLGVAISVDWRWTLITLVGVPLLFLPLGRVQVFIRKQSRAARDMGASLSTRLDEIFHGIVPIKLNRLETYQADRYRGLTDRFIKTEVRSSLGSAAIPGLLDIMAGLGFLAVLVYGGSEIVAGEKTVGQFVSFFAAMGLAFDPIRRLGNLSGAWQNIASGLERVKELMDAPITLTSPDNPVAPPEGLPSVTFDNVTMRYGDTEVLHNVSLVAEAGKTTALVGASGAGKSTIFNLLTRLVDPASGKVMLNDTKVQDLSLDDLRDMISVVTQDALLFDETLRENILLGRTDITDEELEPVLQAANVSDYLKTLPDGLDTLVGPRGSALSGGQRQRVVIARALLRNTPVLLLDEATSALDSQSEKVVQDALDRLAGGRTTLVIAHRLSTVRNADRIVVMDQGRVADIGTHDELIERGGIYANLYKLQFKDPKPGAL
ncbi:ABC transporter ATP-binding protein [Chachezhania antarctica]|uniref:ABC transporter ATP-binding protein n=1 Tax=Chachezhania antarctica TaxID=2340860 RepID=UPI000EB05C53|nr:ABC transporter ATP-binding protein [Chachezhania antarctica]|tara:strand:- start:5827 stop:7638 length:1812 start_codon:yes stop_codon:yes gene_type:complete